MKNAETVMQAVLAHDLEGLRNVLLAFTYTIKDEPQLLAVLAYMCILSMDFESLEAAWNQLGTVGSRVN